MSTNQLVVTNSQYSFPSDSEFRNMKELAGIAVKSGLLPSGIKSSEQALIIMLKGREIGMPPMLAFSHIHVINGKPAMSAELMLAMIYKNCPGCSIEYIKQDNLECKIEAKRKSTGLVSTFSFSIEEAKKANLLGKSTWQQYPAAMLRARAISIMGRAMFPDALMGISYTPEELGAEIEIDADGNEIIKVKDVTSTNTESQQKPKEDPQKQVVTQKPDPKNDQSSQPVQNTEEAISKANTKPKNEALGFYMIKIGTHAGQELRNIKVANLTKYIENVEKYIAEGKPISDDTISDLQATKDYLGIK